MDGTEVVDQVVDGTNQVVEELFQVEKHSFQVVSSSKLFISSRGSARDSLRLSLHGYFK